MRAKWAVVDLFAGAGGLAEGFAAARGALNEKLFDVVLSVEKDPAAFETLRLRSFLHKFDTFPDEYYSFFNNPSADEPCWGELYPEQWEQAERSALHLELGTDAAEIVLDRRLAEVREEYRDRIVLVGGPPCQAYSLIGRARNKAIKNYAPKSDKRFFLYEEYIRVLKELKAAAFVMENVKGLLSAKVDQRSVFSDIQRDFLDAGYQLYALTPPTTNIFQAPRDEDFVVRFEEFGVPQTRHRVIVVGIRKDLHHSGTLDWLVPAQTHVRDAIENLPSVRSGLSRGDSTQAWVGAVREAIKVVSGATPPLHFQQQSAKALEAACTPEEFPQLRDDGRTGSVRLSSGSQELATWLHDPSVTSLRDHVTRGHMPSDLGRYYYASVFSEVHGYSPSARAFPVELAPNHKNWNSGKFADRFRVQLWEQPSSTITSHIAKDGHYYIHPDPTQCRSLTVREAARLQTFKDNYLFKGNRTQQYTQIGNAVPPFIAHQLACGLANTLESLTYMSVPSRVASG